MINELLVGVCEENDLSQNPCFLWVLAHLVSLDNKGKPLHPINLQQYRGEILRYTCELGLAQ